MSLINEYNFKSNNYGPANNILDPNSNFYKYDDRDLRDFFRVNTEKHTSKNYNVNSIDNIYNNLYQEYNKLTDNIKNVSCNGYTSDRKVEKPTNNKVMYLLNRYTELSPVGKIFFSKDNIKRIQNMIKIEVFNRTKGKFILDDDQEDDDVVIVMMYIYQEEARHLPEHIIHQVKRLNQKVINYCIPDILTNIKQDYNYQKEINEPLKVLDRPINDNNKGRKLLPSITSIWNI